MDDGRLERLERRLDELDQRSSSMERMMESMIDRSRQAADMIVPRQTRNHLRAAGRENLLAVRSLLDFWANKLTESDDDSSAAADQSTRENIPID
jgi:uridine kinase